MAEEAVSENLNDSNFMSVHVYISIFLLVFLFTLSNCDRRRILKKSGKLLAIVFKRHYSDLQRGIQSPSELASRLYSIDIITEDVRDRGQMITSTTDYRNAILLNAVERAISMDPQCFWKFMHILNNDPTTKRLHTLLMATYGEHTVASSPGLGQDTTVIRAVRMVERNAFKRPPLLKFCGPLASKRFQKLMTLYRKLHYKGKHDKTQWIRSKLSSSDNVDLDIRLYISALNVTDSSYDIAQGEELLKKCQTLDCQNGSLLQAYCLMSLATLYYDNGDKEKASEYIQYARSQCCVAAPSYLTSLVFYCEARNLLQRHKGNVTPCVKRKAMELFNYAIADSYCGVGWEKYVVCLCHIKMAMFCLGENIGYEFYPSSKYTPSNEDISLAEKHLKAVPKAIPDDELRGMSWYAISYHIALSDLNRLRGDTASAREHVQMAEKVLHERVDLKTAPKYKNKFGIPIRSRLQYLKADSIDEILEELDQV